MLLSIIFPTIFLAINYLYSTFASPILSQGGVDPASDESLNLVIARYMMYPDDHKCQEAIQWSTRVCTTHLDDHSWVDVCRYNPLNPVPFYMVDGSCPPTTMCHNVIAQYATDPEPVETINCVPRATSRNQLAPDRQTGVYTVENHSNSGSSQHNISVILETNLPGATVAALMEGMYYWIPH
jgi:hypothetical protein